MSNAELLAILLRTGTGKMNVLEVAREILREADGRLTEVAGMSVERLCHVDGIGPLGAQLHLHLVLRDVGLAGLHVDRTTRSELGRRKFEGLNILHSVVVSRVLQGRCGWGGLLLAPA